jgi:serine/threonine protein kinase
MEQVFTNNRYDLVRLLGSGGMAQVYLSHDRDLDRYVALKILRGYYAEDDEFVERFRREAQSAAALSHPNIVSVYDRGRSEDGSYYITMEYVSGGTLKDRISRDGPLPSGEAAKVASKVAAALGAAHERGTIHRDVKPQNILLTDADEPKVADFGIARAMSATAVSRTSLMLGTAHYMSPEQAMGDPVDPRSDLYSLGVVLYEMLTGTLPYDAETPIGIAMKHVNEPPRSPKEANPEIPEGINDVTTKLLAKRYEDRYAHAAELIEDLERVRIGLTPLAARRADAEKTSVLPRAPLGGPKDARDVGAPASNARGRRQAKLPRFAAALLASMLMLGGVAWAISGGLSSLGWSTGDSKNALATNEAEGQSAASADTTQEETSAAQSTPQDQTLFAQSPAGQSIPAGTPNELDIEAPSTASEPAVIAPQALESSPAPAAPSPPPSPPPSQASSQKLDEVVVQQVTPAPDTSNGQKGNQPKNGKGSSDGTPSRNSGTNK